MAHEIEAVGNVAKMFYAGKTPWHGIGTAVEREVTAAAAIQLAGLDTENELRPIYIASAKTVDGIPVIGKSIDDKMAVVRKEDDSILGVVGTDYCVIQNKDCFSFLDGVIGEGQAVYHTAGSLFGGKKIFLTVKLPTSMSIGDDKVDKYILLSSSHDGSMAVHLKWTPVRVVCANTLSAALGTNLWKKSSERSSKNAPQSAYMVKHHTNYANKMDEARQALGLCDYYYEQLEICFNKLLDQKMSDNDMEVFASQLFSGEEDKKVSNGTRNKREKICGLFNSLPDLQAVKKTRWAAWNAATYFVDHSRSTRVMGGKERNEVKFASTTFGSGAGLRQKAFDLLTAGITI